MIAYLDEISQKKGQISHHDAAFKKRFLDGIPNKPKGLIGEFLGYFLLNQLAELYSKPLLDKEIVDVGCGSGGEAEFFAGLGAKVVATDISLEGVKCTKRRFAQFTSFSNRLTDVIVADTEHLPFNSRAFDVGVAYDALHHLPHPLRGIRELDRISKEGFMFRESQPTFWLKLLSFFINLDVEESGNIDFRFPKNLLIKTFGTLGLNDFAFRTYFDPNHTFFKKYIFPHFLYSKVRFRLFKWLFYAFNGAFGTFGNALIAVVWKVHP